MIANLYQIRSNAEAQGILGTSERIELRQSKSQRIVKAIWKWIDKRVGKHSSASKMNKALKRTMKQRARFERLLYDSELGLDNNPVERVLHIVALGRK